MKIGGYSNLINLYLNNTRSANGFLNQNPALGVLSNLLNSGEAVSGKSTLSYVQSLKTGASDLKNAVGRLSSPSTYTKVEMSPSSDSVEVISSPNNPPNVTLKIDQVASGQENRGEALDSGARVSQSGLMQFQISSNGRTHLFEVNVKFSDTNMELQRKMADAVNERAIGVTAAVETAADGKTSRVVISAKETGDSPANTFTIKDVLGSAVEMTGTGSMTQGAQDAIYSVNGAAAIKTKSNEVNLGDGFVVSLKSASSEAVSFGRTQSTTASIQALRDMAGGFNDLLASAKENSGDSGADSLVRKLNSIARTYAPSLAGVGVTLGSDGYMSVNESTLTKAAEGGGLKTFFTESQGINYGLTHQLDRLAQDVSGNTAKYVGSFNLGYQPSDYLSGGLLGQSLLYASLGQLFDSWI